MPACQENLKAARWRHFFKRDIAQERQDIEDGLGVQLLDRCITISACLSNINYRL